MSKIGFYQVKLLSKEEIYWSIWLGTQLRRGLDSVGEIRDDWKLLKSLGESLRFGVIGWYLVMLIFMKFSSLFVYSLIFLNNQYFQMKQIISN